MGERYLTDLADVCRRPGLEVVEVDDWLHRARGSGGYNPGCPDHVIVHHTASPPSSDGWPDVDYCTFGDDDAPLCNLYLDRSGTVYVCAGGATNTNGSGQDPCGWCPDDSMNSHAIGIEAGNGGTGERWPDAQCDAYLSLVDALCAGYAIPHGRVHAHAEWAPSRKTDPAGPDRWATGGSTWNMAEFRGDLDHVPPPQPPPTPEDDMPAYLLKAYHGSDDQKAALFWWDGRQIGWVRSPAQRDVGHFVGLYAMDGGSGDPLSNFTATEIQYMIDAGWSGGPVPTGYKPPSKVDSGAG